MLSDAQLLDRYSRCHDEQAFAEVVTRYLNLVYSAALRHSDGDTHLAQDVAQNVFSDLARKASELAEKLEQGQPLVGWLYTSAHFAASSLCRSKNRRQNRERMALVMNDTTGTSEAESEPEWTALRPLLDEAMRDLTATDRDAILLRYFADQDLRSVGNTLGLSEDAVRKRIDRALDRLREWLSSRDIRTTVAALSAAFASHAVQIAPIGLAVSVTCGALVGVAMPSAPKSSGSGGRIFGPSHPATLVAVIASIMLVIGSLAFSKRASINASAISMVSNAIPHELPKPKTLIASVSRPGAVPSKLLQSSWNESSATVRVPKSFLERIPLRPISMGAGGMRSLVLDEQFIRLFRLTPPETEQLKSALAAAQHRYRVEEGRHLEPIEGAISDPLARSELQFGIVLKEQFCFRLLPFPEERKAFRRTFEADVHQILGNERASYFLKAVVEIGPLTINESNPNSSIFTFRLTDRNPLPIVDLHQHSDGSVIGLDYDAPLDQYAPESLKSALVRWRKWIADETSKRNPSLAQNAQAATAERPEVAMPLPWSGDVTPWNDNVAYVDLPKSLIGSLNLAGLTPDESVSPEAVEVCELTTLESDAVRSLYLGMKERFKSMERERFTRVEPQRNKFILRAFPEEAESLRTEWTEKLKELLGENRGELLDELVRTPISPAFYLQKHRRFLPEYNDDVNWLRRGTETMEIEIDPDTRSVRFQSQVKDGNHGSFGPFNPDRVPKRWQHLLTRDLVIWP